MLHVSEGAACVFKLLRAELMGQKPSAKTHDTGQPPTVDNAFSIRDVLYDGESQASNLVMVGEVGNSAANLDDEEPLSVEVDVPGHLKDFACRPIYNLTTEQAAGNSDDRANGSRIIVRDETTTDGSVPPASVESVVSTGAGRSIQHSAYLIDYCADWVVEYSWGIFSKLYSC